MIRQKKSGGRGRAQMKCKQTVWLDYRRVQCSRRATKGDFCFQHDPVAAAQRKMDRSVKYERARAKAPYARARKLTDALEALLAKAKDRERNDVSAHRGAWAEVIRDCEEALK